MTEQKLMTLMVGFDIDQIRPRIDWNFVEADGPDRRALGQGGSWRNNIQFIPGQKFRIDLVAKNYHDKPLVSVGVVDCCLITRPQIQSCGPGTPPKFAPPSPFVSANGAQLGALVSIAGSDFTPQDATPASVEPGRSHTLIWNGHLVVGQAQSHWDLAFYVTVKIVREAGGDPDFRVFYFDPESEVGNGIDPP